MDVSLVSAVLGKDVIQIICIHHHQQLSQVLSASWVCLPFSPSPSSLNPFTPMSPFHTSFRHSEKDQIRPENSGVVIQEGLYYEGLCVRRMMLRDSVVFSTWSESLRTVVCTGKICQVSPLDDESTSLHNLLILFQHSSHTVLKNIHPYIHTPHTHHTHTTHTGTTHTHTHTHTVPTTHTIYTHVSIYTFEILSKRYIFHLEENILIVLTFYKQTVQFNS